MRFFRLILLITLLPFIANAQEERRCGTMEYLNAQIKANPALKDTLDKWNNIVNEWVKVHGANFNFREIITIPVVIHLVYNPSVNFIVSDWQVQSQIDVMNEDLRRRNADSIRTPSAFDGVAADCEFEFCLAKRDPNGVPTTGILREISSESSWEMGSSTLKQNAWPQEKYLNVWVCNLTGGVLGYTTFPGTTDEPDGIVVEDRAFGRIGSFLKPHFALGRTLTHEFGHWVDCFHVWGSNSGDCASSDSCDDTPPQSNSTAGCPSFPHEDICSPNFPGTMYMNYLDYSYDSCMNIYTLDQKLRMMACMHSFPTREAVLTSDGCNQPVAYQNDLAIPNILYPAMTVNKRLIRPVVTLANYGTNTIISCKIYYQFQFQKTLAFGDLHEYDWNGSLSTNQTINISLPSILDSVGFSFLIAYAKLDGLMEEDTINNFCSRSYYVNPNAALPPAGKTVTVILSPNSSIIAFRFDTLITDHTIEIFDILGRPVNFKTDEDQLNIIDLDMLNCPIGVYIARFRNGNNTFTKKFIRRSIN